ncbi:MAG: hypothetical protein FWG53_11310 [Clostridiales bacterium]|nr:hypothetical protein [Clostridiales bacterium]
MDKRRDDTAFGRAPVLLTNRRDVRFELSFKYPLIKGYTFKELEKRNLSDFQRFFDKVARMTVQQVGESFARPPDKDDSIYSKQVLHYEITDSFRIHVILEEGRYVVVRLDPNHIVHR